MTLEDLLAHITTDKTALLFFFLLLPTVTIILTMVSSGRSQEPPFNYIYSMVIFAASIPAVLSLTLWMYSMAFEQKALWHLPFFVYYLPILVLFICIFLMKRKQISLQQLPWSNELHEILVLVVISFASTLIIMKLEILNFHSPWKVGLFFAFWLIVFVLCWSQLKKMR